LYTGKREEEEDFYEGNNKNKLTIGEEYIRIRLVLLVENR
jgi:hypothetical protein